ncbi:hypothetical protein UPYG_G00054650 [Umbra pygmaea]|uniref:C2H2-type domain-containing protein n=1 Tax=Umbra pygmaea TaxID=75934 RepID=A0ABD0XN41_UMBPY
MSCFDEMGVDEEDLQGTVEEKEDEANPGHKALKKEGEGTSSHKEKPYFCSWCEKRFTSASSLKTCIKVHRETLPLQRLWEVLLAFHRPEETPDNPQRRRLKL